MLEKALNASKKLILLRSFCFSLAVGISIFLSTALVASASTPDYNEFIDYDRYATYTYSAEDDFIYADVSLPDDWFYTSLSNSLFEQIENSHSLILNSADLAGEYSYKIKFNPLSNQFNFPSIGTVLSQGRYFNLKYFPKDTFLTFSYGVKFNNTFNNSLENPVFYIVYVDENGEILSYNTTGFTVTVNSGGVGEIFDVSYSAIGTLSNQSVPSNAHGFYFYFQTDGACWPLNNAGFTVTFNSLLLKFRYSEAEYNLNNQKIVRDSVSNIDKTLNEVKAQLDKQNNTLEDILDKQEELPGEIGDEIQGIIDNEKQEAEGEGNKFVDQILDALPDPSADVLAALKSLTDSTAYTGTDAVLPIPAIVLPGIDGLFPETEIWDGVDFDLGHYINMLPPALLTLVQSLFTIAIVLFCVYELKGIISYCLTLRDNKGG